MRNLRRFPRRAGLAALEVVLVIGAMLPIAVILFRLLCLAVRYCHALIGNVAGSPTM